LEVSVIRSFEELRDMTRQSPKTLVVAAAHDCHTLEAVFTAVKMFSMRYLLVGNREKIMSISSQIGEYPEPDTIVDCGDNECSARKAVIMVREGCGDAIVKGIIETSTLLKAIVNRDSGIRASGSMSHLAMLEIPAYHKLMSITDGGMIPNPDFWQKVDIVRNTVAFYKRIGCDRPKIAVLCASESRSSRMQETVDAAALQDMCQRGELGDCQLEGPLSFDIAISRDAAETKGFLSEISGDTDVLLVPNITTGNVLAKGLIYMGGAKLAGCVLGAKVPVVLPSRGATTEEKLDSIMMSLIGD